MKNLRSVKRRSDDRFEYVRVHNEDAKELVNSGDWVYISNQEYKQQSMYAHFVPCQGTIHAHTDAEGVKSYTVDNNINWNKKGKGLRSTKLGAGSMATNVWRKGKYAKRG